MGGLTDLLHPMDKIEALRDKALDSIPPWQEIGSVLEFFSGALAILEAVLEAPVALIEPDTLEALKEKIHRLRQIQSKTLHIVLLKVELSLQYLYELQQTVWQTCQRALGNAHLYELMDAAEAEFRKVDIERNVSQIVDAADENSAHDVFLRLKQQSVFECPTKARACWKSFGPRSTGRWPASPRIG